MTKRESIDILFAHRIRYENGHLITKKDLGEYSARQLYGAWMGFVVRGESRCGIFDQIISRKICALGQKNPTKPIKRERPDYRALALPVGDRG